jgi:hypothetical protein
MLLPRPRPDLPRQELPARITSGSSCLKADLTDAWLDAWRERDGDVESVYREALVDELSRTVKAGLSRGVYLPSNKRWRDETFEHFAAGRAGAEGRRASPSPSSIQLTLYGAAPA